MTVLLLSIVINHEQEDVGEKVVIIDARLVAADALSLQRFTDFKLVLIELLHAEVVLFGLHVTSVAFV